ncbi:MAG: DNA primase [Candidatus Moranbacteria bacterium RBG_13_45_13]|nr:MAG: DNA primase [Candidatus Moranbacteria bacterium RBG_13_45_13]
MSDVEEIKNRLGIVELVGEYIRLQKAGSNWRALCPFHNEKTPSFMVSDERRSFHCFGCGKGGDIFTFVMEMEGLGFREALEQLAGKAGVELQRSKIKDQGPKVDKARPYQILELATKWYEKNLWEGKGKEKILKYLRERGLKDETMKKFRLGYAPDGWRNLLDFLLKKDYKVEEIVQTGLLVEKNKEQIQNSDYYDRFRDRIMFPIQDVMGRVVGYSARVAPGGDEKTAKYINTPQTEIYDKSKVLYGLHLAKTEIKKQDEAILVEGNMDVIASHQAGFSNTIAVSGTALASEQVKAIKRYTENVKMAFDMDPAGQAAAKRSAEICLENDLNVKIVILSSGKDAADVVKEDKEVWKKALQGARHVVEYYFEDVFSRYDSKNPTDKKKIAKELLNVIKDIASPVEQSHWLKILAEKLGTEEKILSGVLKNVGSKDRTATPQKKEEKKAASLERRILGLALAFPKETKKQLKKINPEIFSGVKEKEIAAKIEGTPGEIDGESLKASLPDYESRKIIDESIFEIEVEAENAGASNRYFDPADELKTCIKRMRQLKFREKIARLSQDIREAEKNGDKAAVGMLIKEFQKLTEEMEK